MSKTSGTKKKKKKKKKREKKKRNFQISSFTGSLYSIFEENKNKNTHASFSMIIKF